MDVLAIAETKVDSSFPTSQFLIDKYKTPFRLDITDRSGGLLVYVKAGIPTRRLINLELPQDIQIIAVELRLKNTKWLSVFIYRPPSQDLEYFLHHLTTLLDFYSNFRSCIIMGDFNCEPACPKLVTFMEGNLLFNHMKSKTCFKSNVGTCIDLILSNQKFGLQHTCTQDTGLSDFHHLISTELKCTYTKLPPRKVTYRSFRNFDENKFLDDLSHSLCSNISDYDSFNTTFESVVDRHAPQKSRLVRGNEKSYMNKALRKAIMRRSRLRNVYLKSRSTADQHAYRQQRNYVTNLVRKTRKSYFESVASQSSNKSHHFWKLCKPFLSNSSSHSDRIMLVKDDNILSDESEIAEAFNSYYRDITKELDLVQWSPSPLCPTFSDPIFQAIAKYEDHPSIVKIRSLSWGQHSFSL